MALSASPLRPAQRSMFVDDNFALVLTALSSFQSALSGQCVRYHM
jgi:hypothetical protein